MENRNSKIRFEFHVLAHYASEIFIGDFFSLHCFKYIFVSVFEVPHIYVAY